MIKFNPISKFSNFGSYKLSSILIRLILISAISIGLIQLAKIIGSPEIKYAVIPFKIYFLTIIAFSSASEASLGIIKLFRKSKKFRDKIYLQTLALIITSAGLVTFWLFIIENSLKDYKFFQDRTVQTIILIALLMLIIHWLVVAISVMTKEQLENREEIEELKRAKLLSDYNSLKDKLNPHFLFNNLSVLKSLIHYNPESAEKFTENFTDVYRYVLKSHDSKTVTLNEEITFIKSYIALHQERLGAGLNISFNIKENDLQYSLPPLSLQLLVENAIKHNVANKNTPLNIEIYSENLTIIVKNNMNKKETTYSTLSGLSSLGGQYRLLANKGIEIIENDHDFKVILPLI